MKEAIQIILGIIGGLLAAVFLSGGLFYLFISSQIPQADQNTQVVNVRKPPTAGQIVSLVNDERKKRGIAPLKVHPKLNESAQAKANDLYTNEYFEHENPRTGKMGYDYVFDFSGYELCNVGASENLAQGQVSPAEFIEDWLDSPGHREAMLGSEYDLTGVAVVKDYRPGGGYIAVQHFCDVE